jgi:hypothetical protein
MNSVIFLLCVVLFLQFVQIGMKVLLWLRVSGTLPRVERLLSMTEAHAQVTDSRGERIEAGAKKAAATAAKVAGVVKAAVEAIPEKVSERLKSDSVPDSEQVPIVKPPN